jgi:hypothetical protein
MSHIFTQLFQENLRQEQADQETVSATNQTVENFPGQSENTAIPVTPIDSPPTPLAEDMVQHVRRAVREFGKEAATYRFTELEKQTLAEIIYAYKKQGIRTNENEIARIAINALFHNYQKMGENSLLHKILVSLNE